MKLSFWRVGLFTVILSGGTWLPAQATLMGDQINGEARNSVGQELFTLSPTSSGNTATVGNGIEFFAIDQGDGQAFVDFSASTLSLRLFNTSTFFTGLSAELDWLFTDLDWTGNPQGRITGLVLNSGNSLPVISTSFTDHSLRINTGAVLWPPQTELLATFTIQTNHASSPVPEPSTMLLFGSGLAGLIRWRYRHTIEA